MSLHCRTSKMRACGRTTSGCLAHLADMYTILLGDIIIWHMAPTYCIPVFSSSSSTSSSSSSHDQRNSDIVYDARARPLQKLSKLCTSNTPLAPAPAAPPPNRGLGFRPDFQRKPHRSSTTHSHSANKVHFNRLSFRPCAPTSSNSNRNHSSTAHSHSADNIQ